MRSGFYGSVSAWVRPAELVVLSGLVLLLWPVFSKIGSLSGLRGAEVIPVLRTVVVWSIILAGTTAVVTTTLAYFSAYWLAFCTRHGSVIAIMMLIPYAVSYYAHLVAMKTLAGLIASGFLGQPTEGGRTGYGVLLMVSAMVVRYFPLALIFVYLRMRSLPQDLVAAAKNLSISTARLHVHVLAPHSRVILLFLGVFLLCLAAMDHLAPSIGGGGRLQTLGILVEDWHRTQSLRDFSVGLGGSIALLVAVLILVVSIPIAGSSRSSRVVASESKETQLNWDGALGLASAGFVGSVFVLAQGAWIGSLSSVPDVRLLFTEAATKFPMVALRNSTGAALLAGMVGVLSGLLSAFALHLTRSPRSRWLQEGAMPVAMLFPLLLPPLAVGICLRESLGALGLGLGSWWIVGIGHLFIYLPVAWFVCISTNERLGADLQHAARNHGVKLWSYFSQIYLRYSRGPMIVAVGLLFFLSMNEAIVSPYLSGFDPTLGKYIQTKQVVGIGPAEGVLLALLTMGTILALAGGGWILSMAAQRAEKPPKASDEKGGSVR